MAYARPPNNAAAVARYSLNVTRIFVFVGYCRYSPWTSRVCTRRTRTTKWRWSVSRRVMHERYVYNIIYVRTYYSTLRYTRAAYSAPRVHLLSRSNGREMWLYYYYTGDQREERFRTDRVYRSLTTVMRLHTTAVRCLCNTWRIIDTRHWDASFSVRVFYVCIYIYVCITHTYNASIEKLRRHNDRTRSRASAGYGREHTGRTCPPPWFFFRHYYNKYY